MAANPLPSGIVAAPRAGMGARLRILAANPLLSGIATAPGAHGAGPDRPWTGRAGRLGAPPCPRQLDPAPGAGPAGVVVAPGGPEWLPGRTAMCPRHGSRAGRAPRGRPSSPARRSSSAQLPGPARCLWNSKWPSTGRREDAGPPADHADRPIRTARGELPSVAGPVPGPGPPRRLRRTPHQRPEASFGVQGATPPGQTRDDRRGRARHRVEVQRRQRTHSVV
jgi:hypothetical protein